MRKASIDVKTGGGTYRVYRCEFASKKHFNNWYDKMVGYGYSIVGVSFDDGYQGMDGWNKLGTGTIKDEDDE